MKKLLQKLKRNTRGFVTVFVTLMLIPAVLITGTGVDMARIYSAQSILSNANQLAANSALTQYNALLQDLYGLYAVMVSDAELGSMINEYVEMAILGEKWNQSGTGTFQLMGGAELASDTTITVGSGQYMSNPDVIRRQIEEYVKYRAPVVIIDEVLDRIESFKDSKRDADAIADKMEIDEQVEDIDDKYREIYDAMTVLDNESIESAVRSVFYTINSRQAEIQDELQAAYLVREQYLAETNEDLKSDYEIQYETYLENVNALINGGTLWKTWKAGEYDEDGNYVNGEFTETENHLSMNSLLGSAKATLEYYIEVKSGAFSDSFISLTELKVKIEDAKQDIANLSSDINNLKGDLLNCSQDLQDGLLGTGGQEGELQKYEELFDVNELQDMITVCDKNITGIQNAIKVIDEIGYYCNGWGHSRLGSLSTSDCPINYNPSYDGQDKLGDLVAATPYTYSSNFTYDKFSDEAFYTRLDGMYSSGDRDGDGDDDEDAADEKEDELFDSIDDIMDAFDRLMGIDVEGALSVQDGSSTGDGSALPYDKNSPLDADDQMQNSLEDDNNLLAQIGDLANSIGNKALLVVYCSEMFSCYTTARNQDEGAEAPVSLTGVPLGLKVNYFYQSELEYLFTGSNDARVNLTAVGGMIFLVRFVFNYISSFSITTVKTYVEGIKTTLGWLGPIAIVVGELARLALAMGESVFDVCLLKAGAGVPLFKDNTTWKFDLDSIGTLLDTVTDVLAGKKVASTGNVYYLDYLRIFLLLKDGDTIAERTVDLIQWNMLTYQNDIGSKGQDARPAALTTALNAAKGNGTLLASGKTGFTVTTTIHYPMLFLSLPITSWVEGAAPPGTMTFTATDYRGY